MNSIDWTYLQSFVAVIEAGSLSAAARATGRSQPTISRHIALLEEKLGCRLFMRSKQGAELTPTGLELIDHAQAMADAASRLTIANDSADSGLAGTVRITASEIVATYLLPEILVELHLSEPDIELEVVASDDTENLLRREADIAIRMYRPTQLDVVTKKIGELAIGAYAAESYLERKGIPLDYEDILQHDLIGYDRSSLIIDGFKNNGLDVTRDFFRFRSDNQIVCWQMVVAGFGIGFNQRKIGDAEPRVVNILGKQPLGQMPIWLTAHQELKTSARVRRVYDFLAEKLKNCI